MDYDPDNYSPISTDPAIGKRADEIMKAAFTRPEVDLLQRIGQRLLCDYRDNVVHNAPKAVAMQEKGVQTPPEDLRDTVLEEYFRLGQLHLAARDRGNTAFLDMIRGARGERESP